MRFHATDLHEALRWFNAGPVPSLHAHPVLARFSRRLTTPLMQRTLDRMNAMRQLVTPPAAPTAEDIQQRRQAILAMPVRHGADLRRKVLAMVHTDARLLPADTDVTRLLATPEKARCVCDTAVIVSMMRMRDEGLTLLPEHFLAMDTHHVPYRDGRTDFSMLEVLVTQMLASGECYGADDAHVTALNQLLQSGLFNGCLDQEGMAFPLRLHLRAGIERLATCYRNDFPALLNHLPRQTLNCPDRHGTTPLATAIALHSVPLVTALLRRGAEASLNEADRSGTTPLLAAVRSTQPGVVRALLIMGAEASLGRADYHGTLPLRAAVEAGATEIVQLLLPYSDAAALNHPDPRDGATPLLTAVRSGHADLVRLLLAKGAAASVNQPDALGITPLQAAGEQVALVMALLEHGADLAGLHGVAQGAATAAAANPTPRALSQAC
ncbi:MAG TPA: ankyrin repeat domain-containing protein [Burkholderiaceae bacterium]|nr:ankyrin repeat domain-containing protein [Burkholderiaceae bacterium]